MEPERKAAGSPPRDDIWKGYYRRRRLWFLGVAPALVLLIAINAANATAAGLLAVCFVTAVVIAAFVLAARFRLRRMARAFAAMDSTFCGEAVVHGEALMGDGELLRALHAASRGKPLGIPGMMSIDPVGLHWVSTGHKPELRLELQPQQCTHWQLTPLGFWMSGLAIWTTGGDRVAFLLPKADREAAGRALAKLCQEWR